MAQRFTKQEFSTEVTRSVRSAGGLVTERISTSSTFSSAGKSENYVVVKEHTSDGFSVDVGDFVEAVEYAADSSKEARIDASLDVGEIGKRLDNSAARHKLSVRPRRKYADPRAVLISQAASSRALVRKADGTQGWLPMSILMQTALSEDSTAHHKPEDSQCRREAVMKELIETEEEFGRDLQMVVEKYLKPLDNPDVPRAVRDNKELIFTNLKQIADFHNTSFGRVLIEGVKYYANEPRMLGKTFLRLAREFDKHVVYCRDEPAAQDFLQANDQVREYFEELSQKLGDDKSLSEHLKLPIQRINDYQLLLKELVKYSTRLGEDSEDLQKALELMLGIPHQASDNKFTSNIEGFKGNIHKLGRLLTHEWFTVTDKEGKSKERYLFLFKARILVCKVRRISEDRSVFILKDIIRLPEVELKDYPDDTRKFELHPKESPGPGHPISFTAHKDPVKETWLKEIRLHASDVVALAEHAADDLQLTEDKVSSPAEALPPAGDMSRRYSSSRFSASSNVIEESSFTSMSSSRMSTEVSSSYAASSTTNIQQSGGSVIETSSSYQQTAVAGGNTTARLGLTTNAAGKPEFEKTIEGCQVEQSRAKLAMLHVIAGECATFECTMKSSDILPKMVWLKDNKPMDDKLADRVKTTIDGTNYKLQIENVLESDSGIYTARASNGDAQATCTAQLVVQELTVEEKKVRAEANSPIFLVRLKDTELLENTYLRFMIKVKGDPNPDLKFFKDDVLIDSKNERIKIIKDKADKGFYEIVIPDVQNQDAGKYSCTAQNRFGETSCEATVTVTDEKLIFTGLPEGLLEPGTEPKFMWTRDGVPFDPEERFKVLFKDSEDTLALVFQHVKPEDAGLYTCVAQTSTGNISCSAELTVQGTVNQLMKEPQKPALQSEAKTSEVSAGGSAMLDLQVKGFPKPNITWTKDGQEIIAGGRIKYLWEDEESLSLVIKNVTIEDAGIYKIRARNELGEDNTQIELIVKSAPKITKRMSNVSVKHEETIKMSVQIQASPGPEVKWYKDNKLIEESDRIAVSKEADNMYSITVKDARHEDAGSYSVVAKNEVNETSQFWDLSVKFPPKITKKLGDSKLIEEGDNLTLFIEAESNLPPTVTWMKDEEVIKISDKIKIEEDGNKYTLQVSNLVDTDTANYKVIIENQDGKRSDQCKIQVRSAPLFRKGLEETVTKEGDKDIVLSVEIESFSKPEVEWYFKGSQITEAKKEFTMSEEGNTYKLIIKSAKTEVAGIYTCKAKNEVGTSKSAAPLVVHFKPKLVKKLADQKVKEGDTLQLSVQVSSVPDPVIKWFKDGQEVSADARIKITRDSQRLENYDLTVTLLKGSDGGVYEMRATNDLGFVSSKSKIIVLTKSEEMVEDKEQVAKVEEIKEQTQKAEEAEPEGRVKVEKQKVEVVKGPHGETITISVKSTTEHESTLSGPDERHSISKMTSTKVECQEMTSEINGPQVEEIASYSYTLQEEENSLRGQNGIVEEYYSESEDGRNNGRSDILKVNRGVSIVSVSDDDNTSGKGISRDVSCDDVRTNFEYSEEYTIVNGGTEERPRYVIEESSTKRALYTQTIIEEQSIDGSASVSRRESTASSVGNVKKEKAEKRESITSDIKFVKEMSECSIQQNAKLEESAYKRQTSERRQSILAQESFAENQELSFPDKQKAKSLSRQSSQFKRLDSTESQKVREKTLSRNNSMRGSIDEGRLSRQNSKIERLESVENHKVEEKTLTRQTSKRGSIEEGLSRQSSRTEKLNSTENQKPREKTLSRENSIKGTKLIDEEEDDEDMKKLFDRIKRQRSVLDEILEQKERRTSLVEEKAKDEIDGYKSAPKIIKPLHSKTVQQGETIKLVVQIEAIPTPEITWLKNNRFIRESSRVYSSQEDDITYSLTIDNARHQDAGTYSVVAKNKTDEITQSCDVEVKYPPVIIKKLDECKLIEEGDYLNLYVRVESETPAEVTWMKDEEVVKYHDRIKIDDIGMKHSLQISNVVENDSAIYKIIIVNQDGKCSDECTVQVKKKLEHNDLSSRRKSSISKSAPKILKSLSDVTVQRGDTIKMLVQIQATPAPEIKWLKDNKSVRESDRVSISKDTEDHYTIIIKEARPEDSATYSVIAKNEVGETSRSCDVSVKCPPRIIKKLGEYSVQEEGDSLTLNIEVESEQTVKVIWMKDNEVIKIDMRVEIEVDGNKHSLKIADLVKTDTGTYNVEVKNQDGIAVDDCKVQVIKKPINEGQSKSTLKISNSLSDVTVQRGESIEIPVQIEGSPVAEVKWYKDDKPIRESDRVSISKDTDNTYSIIIKDVKSEDTARYTVVAKNEVNEASQSCDVTVKCPPIIIKKLGESKVLDEDDTLTLYVEAVSESPLTATWMKDEETIKIDKRIEIEINGIMHSLQISGLVKTDTAIYSVELENEDGKCSDKCAVKVLKKEKSEDKELKRKLSLSKSAPKINKGISNISIQQGEIIKIPVEIQATPAPEVQWLKNNVPLKESDRILISKDVDNIYSITIEDTQLEDAGTYTVTAKNDIGQTSQSADLTVKCPPKITKKLGEHRLIAENDSLTLYIEAESHYPLTVNWIKDEEILKTDKRTKIEADGNKYSLQIRKLVMADTATYKVTIANQDGKCSDECRVQIAKKQSSEDKPARRKTSVVKIAPKIIQDMMCGISVLSGEMIKMSVQIQGTPEPEVMWLKDNKPIKESDGIAFMKDADLIYSITVKDASLEDAGTYSVVVKNEVDQIIQSANVCVRYPPKITKKLGEPRLIEEGDCLVLYIEAESHYPLMVSWTKNDEVIKISDRVITENDGNKYSLQISDLKENDSASYKVQIENQDGKCSDECGVKVIKKQVSEDKLVRRRSSVSKTAPKITKSMGDVSVLPGEVINMSVQIQGSPALEVIWFKDNQPVKESYKIICTKGDDNMYLITIKDASLEDAGTYSVVAKNEVGQVAQSVDVFVRYPPRITKGLGGPKLIEEGDSLVLYIEVEAYSPLAVTWMREDEIIQADNRTKTEADGNKYSLQISKLLKNDSASYKVKIENQDGKYSDECRVEVLAKQVSEDKSQRRKSSISKIAPKITKDLSDVSVLPGKTVILSVQIHGIPAPEVMWFKDNQPVKESGRITYNKDDANTYSISIKDGCLEDAGTYTVVAKNEIGQVAQSAGVSVRYPPRIIRKLGDSRVIEEGDILTLSIEAESYYSLTVIWMKDGEIIHPNDRIKIEADGDKYSLKIFNLIKNDSASYTVEIANQDGKCSDECVIHVIKNQPSEDIDVRRKSSISQAGPKIIKNMSDISIPRRATIKLSVQVQASPTSEVMWFKDNKPIKESSRIICLKDDDNMYSIVVNDAKMEDEGTYSVVVKNEVAEVSQSAEVTVRYPPRITKKLGEYHSIEEREQLILYIEVESYSPLTVTWMKDGKTLNVDERIKIEKDGNRYSLQISKMMKDDAATYQVEIKNRDGSDSDKCIVEVTKKHDLQKLMKNQENVDSIKYQTSTHNEKSDKQEIENGASPEIISSTLEDRDIFATQSTSFEVKATGLPRPEAKWFKDGEPLKTSKRIQYANVSETFTLNVTKALEEDSGLYTVVFTNKLGEKSVEGFLTVEPVDELRRPKLNEPLTDADVDEGKTGTFKAVITGDPIPEAIWSLNGEIIDLDDGRHTAKVTHKVIEDSLKQCTYTLEITQTNPGDRGNYMLQVMNEYGECSTNADLELRIIPIIEEFKNLMAPVGENVTWEATIKANPRPTIKWYCDGRDVTLDERFTTEDEYKKKTYKLKIKGVEIPDAGCYKIVATNDMGEASEEALLKPFTEPPVFTKELPNYESVRDQNNYEGEVRVTGYPRPTITWMKNGIEIFDDMRNTIQVTVDGPETISKYTIERFCDKDAGNYSCQATNMAGTIHCVSELSLTRFPPKFFTTLPPSLDLDQGEPLELFAKCDGSPIPKVSWYKDGELIKPDDHLKIETLPDGTMRLFIDRVKPTDSGAYKVVASNTGGDNPSQCAVAVRPEAKEPYFSKSLDDVKAKVGDLLKLEARVVAFPNPTVQWLKDGRPLYPSKDNYFINEPNGLIGLTIEKLKLEDAGTYSLVVSNDIGEITGISEVIVEEIEKPPTFVGTLHPMSVVEGFPAKMEVKAIGKPAPLLKWTHNGVEIIPDGQHIKIVDQPDGSQALVIDKVGPADAGEYEVIASSDQGEQSCKAPLELIGKTRANEPEEGPKLLSPFHPISVEEGEPLILEALFTGNPLPDITWTKDNKPLELSNRVLASCDGRKVKLEINPSISKDTGHYACELRNPHGVIKGGAPVTVRKVFQAPSFIQHFSDLQQMIGHSAKFPARVSGIPQPEITWYFDDQPIVADNDKYKIKRDGESVCLYVKDCCLADTGRYKCRASNREGKADCEANLSVVKELDKIQKVEAPSFLKRVNDCEVYKGMTAKFTACVTGFPEPEFEWYRDNTKLWPTDRILIENEGSGLLRLSIYHADEDDVGKYALRIWNPHGEAKSTGDMIFETLEPKKKRLVDQYAEFDKYRKSGVPLPLADRPIISRMMDRHLTLSWKPSIPTIPRVPVTYQVEMCELPDGDWFSARSGIRGCVCDIRNLIPFRDYRFRVRVENKYGISEPSAYAQTYRSKLEPDPPKFYPYLPPGIDFRPETSPYFPKDFDIERPPHDNYAQAPRFLRQEHDTQYGVKNQNSKLFWFVYGYPKPKMTYYFNGQLIEPGGRYDYTYTRNGQATLFINKMLERDVGEYEAVATNEHGVARQRVQLEIAEYPTFITRPDETHTMIRKCAKFECRVTGVPYPELKWYKDWKPLAPSTRIKMQFVEPDISILIIEDVILKDEGLYSLSARNVAGSASSSAMLHVVECEADWRYKNYTIKADVKPKSKPMAEDYDLGDELGRGTQGITYHAAERNTGRNYAAKQMYGGSEYRNLMYNELDAMNNLNHRKLIRLHDSYETDRTFTLITELAGGGELVDNLTRHPFYTESDIAGYIRQLLLGLNYMHDNGWAHCGLTLSDLLISHPNGDDLKIADFGLARRIIRNKLMTLTYGMPEFVPPEVTNGEGIDYGMDMWSTGIITYILLSGISPFRGVNDRETLTKIKEGKWNFDEDRWSYISDEAKDFIRNLLSYQTERRMDAQTALRHPWLNLYADKPPSDLYKIPSEYLKNYYVYYRDWYKNASCRTWYRKRKLESAFEHPSKMVYPPGHRFTPERSPERQYVIPPLTKKAPPPPKPWESRVPSREPIDTEIGLIKNESHYQNGPDTYLLQLRDTDFPVRLREYMKVAYNRGTGFPRQFSDDAYDWRTPVIRERRRFTDVMDEEIDDERRARINQYGNVDTGTLRRLKHELGTRLDTYTEMEAMMEAKKEGQMPFMREKPHPKAIQDGEPAQVSCLAVGDPQPIVQWFKNDCVVQESNRVKIAQDADGRSILSMNPAREHDAGVYKVVARNKNGQTVARARLVCATIPCSPDSPEITDASDSEILLRWKQPRYDGNSPVICYSLQYRQGDGIEWVEVAGNIDHEFFLVHDLKPNTSYNFRLAARNRIGWSEHGVPTKLTKTRAKQEEVPKVQITRAMKHLQQLTESGREVPIEEPRLTLDYSRELMPMDWDRETRISERYSFVSELHKGRFSLVAKGIEKSQERIVVAKIFEVRPDTEQKVEEEFEALRSLCHERIALLEAAFWPRGSPVAALVLEKLQGADVLTYLASRHEYTEQCVASIVNQVLDALQYLHWRGYCHLDIQPDNVVMASVRATQIKLVDYGSTRRVSRIGTQVPMTGHPEYASPEVLNSEPAYPQSDIWQLGVLTYVLLSGVSPFRGADVNETRQNITFVRYRFEYLYKELTQEATRFLMLVFKRSPSKRPTAEECLEHRWFSANDYMQKKRERSVFLGNRLKEYSEEYHEEKRKQAIQGDKLSEAFGNQRQLARSTSIQDELLTTF